ncbi:MAG: DMT family transporter [Spirochaetia bacterium]|nr:DMT family transporter [Spirochaetia bacterium]
MKELSQKESILKKPLVAYSLAVFCTLLWGSAFPSIKLGYQLFNVAQQDVPSIIAFAGSRFTLAGILVLIMRLFLRAGSDKNHLSVKQWSQIGLLGLLQTTAVYIFFYISLSYTTGAKGAILNSLSVFFSAILAHFFFSNDKISRTKLIGILLGFVAVILVNYEVGFGFDFSLKGEGFMIIATIFVSLAFIVSKRLTKFADPMLIAGSQLAFGGLILLIIGLSFGGSFPKGPFKAYLLLLYLASLSAIAFSVWTSLLKYHNVSTITVYNFLVPVVGTFLSVVILGEKVFQIQYLIALPLVAIGIYIVNKE